MVTDIDLAAGTACDGVRRSEITVASANHAPGLREPACRSELLHAANQSIRDVDIPFGVHGNAEGIEELTVSNSGDASGLNEVTIAGGLLDAPVISVADQDITTPGDREVTGIAELTIAGARGSPRLDGRVDRASIARRRVLIAHRRRWMTTVIEAIGVHLGSY